MPKKPVVKIPETKLRAPRNRTLSLSTKETAKLSARLLMLKKKTAPSDLCNSTINQDLFAAARFLPDNFVDLLFVDPPYNLDKKFNSGSFRKTAAEDYETFIESWLAPLLRTLKSTASVYVCADWRSSYAVYKILTKHLIVRNRITWEREKGRGAAKNWKNCVEDIWFATFSDDYHFDVDAVKIKRKVLAPYTDLSGAPKDWDKTSGGNFRLSHPSNIWTDLTVPYWSMSENTDHPTQKPEKLLAKIILASSRKSDFVFDPFLGSGTTSVTAKKLGRQFCGVELDPYYACLCEKRLELAEANPEIQGYNDGVFWERNSKSDIQRNKKGIRRQDVINKDNKLLPANRVREFVGAQAKLANESASY